MVKSCGWCGGGPCDYCVSPSPKNWDLGFFRLGLNLGSGFGTGDWGLGLGLDNKSEICVKDPWPRLRMM